VLILGSIRLALPIQGSVVKVGLVTSDLPANDTVVDEGRKAERLFQDYSIEIERLAAQGAQAIVLPEKLAVVLGSDTKNTDTLFQALADRTHTTLVVGLLYVAAPNKYNRARVYLPNAPVLNYDKHHMLPPFESPLKPGTTLTILPQSTTQWGVAICKDMDFTPLSREYGRQGVGLMLVPGWDFNLDRGWHGHIAVMRAVEDGFSLIRAAKNGYLTVSDNRGRILAETRSDSSPFVTLLADVPAGHSSTLFLLLGDWFAWISAGTLFITLIQLVLTRKSTGQQTLTPDNLAEASR